jgi:retron-type reverse transcriptase
MKRAGNLYAQICTQEALLAAFHRAAKNKRAHHACFEFGRQLGSNIEQLATELQTEVYQPKPCTRFWVRDGRKPRLIEAPAFRDLVVQHAVYAAVSPVLERHYIDTNFACRVGKGTHKAADWLQAAMRRANRTAWVLHIDVRKFFYSLDREVLAELLARFIKCDRTLYLMRLFAVRLERTGVPIGNLLSQTFANVYLNSLDQYCKRTLKVGDFARYMDDSIMLPPDRATGERWLEAIRQHLALLGLEISHYSLQPVKRGANFCGFRTWATARFVRPHVIKSLRRDVGKNRIESVVSRLGHAMRTCSFQPLLTHLKDHHHDLFTRLPQSYRQRHYAHTAPA